MSDATTPEPPRYGERVAPTDASGYATQPATAPETATAHVPTAAVPTAPAPGAPLPTVSASQAPVPTPTERAIRGVLLSLLVIPTGATVWVILWNMGFIASLASFAIAWGAVQLYRIGSGSRVTRATFWALLGVIVAAVAIAFFAGLANDLISTMHLTWTQAVTGSAFWPVYWDNIFTNPDMWASYAGDIAMTLVFTALGCFGTIRRLAQESRA